eukprot:scaffold106_cov123-Cylindrotheca_fusiformis.AAC.12
MDCLVKPSFRCCVSHHPVRVARAKQTNVSSSLRHMSSLNWKQDRGRRRSKRRNGMLVLRPFTTYDTIRENPRENSFFLCILKAIIQPERQQKQKFCGSKMTTNTHSVLSPHSKFLKMGLCIVVLQVLVLTKHGAQSFCQVTTRRSALDLHAAPSNIDDDISNQLARARQILAKSKAKIEAREQAALEAPAEPAADIPFFAAKNESPSDRQKKKDKVVKNKNAETGLSTFDGEMMAALSESEEWQVRRLQDVFENERKGKPDDPFSNRDVAASIFNLRKTLQMEDYQRIFDKRNRFIGEQ